MRRVLAVAAALALMGAGLTASTAAQADPSEGDPAGYPAATLGRGGSSDAALQAREAECGFVAVPLDHAHPDGTKIKLAVSRIKHTVAASKYQGVMLVNPGGPGGAGLSLSVLGSYVPDGVGASYDWIGFDPRGVGASEPKLACDGKYAGYRRPAYVPDTAAIEKAWLNRTSAYAKACDKAGGALLDHLHTTDTVRDMESIRQALGAPQINYYGYSYGTYLGQVYATLYPKRVRRMVLDGNVNPRRIWYDANLDQNLAFDRNIKIYFDWLAKYDSVYHLGTSGAKIEKGFYAQQKALARKPAAGVIGPSELTDVFLQAGYYVFGWDSVARAYASWVNDGDARPLKALYDQGSPQTEGSDNGYAIYLGVQCTDVQWPKSWRKWQQDNWRVHQRAPFETWGNAWYNAPCLSWGAKAAKPVQVDGSKAPPILLISETLDAATPFSGSLEVRKLFPRSALVEGVGGTTHAGSLFGSPCVDDSVAAYLATGALPHRVKANRSDRRCDPLPAPDPTAAAGKRAADLSRTDLRRLIGPR